MLSVKARVASSPGLPERVRRPIPIWMMLFCAYLALLPLLGGFFEEPFQGGFPQEQSAALLRVLLLACAALRIVDGRRGGRPWRLHLPLAVVLLVGWAFLATAVGTGPAVSIRHLPLLGAGVLTLILAAEARDPPHGREWVLGALLAGGAVCAAWGIREYVRTVHELGDASWRIFSTFQGPNLLASYLLPCVLLGLSALLAGERPWLAGIAAATLLCAVGLMLTGSRGAVVYSLPAAFLVWAILAHVARERDDPRALRRQRARLGVVLVLGSILGAAFMKPTVSRVGSSASTGDANSSRFRLLTWKGTLRVIEARPVFGWGPGMWETAYPPFARAGYAKAAHNGYLQTAAEMGLPGLALWLWVLAVGLRSRRPIDLWEAGRISALVATMLHNGVDYGWLLYGPAAMTWALIGSGGPATSDRDSAGRQARSALGYGRASAATVAVLLTASSLPAAYADWKSADGMAALAAGDPVSAENDLATAAALDPAEPTWPEWRGLVRLNADRDPAGAIVYFKRAAVLDPRRAAHRYRLAQAEERAGDAAAAHRDLEAALALDPNATQAMMELARLDEAHGRHADAIALYRRVTAVQESDVGRVKALAEMEDPTYSLARLQLLQEALGRSDPGEARRQAQAGLQTSTAYLEGMKVSRPALELQGRFHASEADAVRQAHDHFEQFLRASDLSRSRPPPPPRPARR